MPRPRKNVSLFMRALGEVASPDAVPKGDPMPKVYAEFLSTLAHRRSRGCRHNHETTFRLLAELPAAERDHPSVRALQQWAVALRRAYAASTSQTYLDCARAMFSWANKMGSIIGNPAALVPDIDCGDGDAQEPISEIDRRWPRMLVAMPDERERAMLGCFRWLGPRKAETLGIMAEDFSRDLEGEWWWTCRRQREANKFTTTPTKGRRARTLFVPHALRPMVLPLLSAPRMMVKVGKGGQRWIESPFLFPYRVDALEELLTLLAEVEPEIFGDPGQAWHRFRHTFAHALKLAGASDEEISKMLGHADTKTTQVYLSKFVGAKVGRTAMQRAFGFGPLGVVRGNPAGGGENES